MWYLDQATANADRAVVRAMQAEDAAARAAQIAVDGSEDQARVLGAVDNSLSKPHKSTCKSYH